MNARVGLLGLLVWGTLTGWGCSDNSVGQPDEHGGGTTELVGGAGGEGGYGKPDSDECTELADYSGEDGLTLEELEASCDADDLTAYRSSCGGTYVEAQQAETESSWVFDAAGELIGGSYEDEGSCYYWGSTCVPVGKGESLCKPEPTCVEHLGCEEWGANFYCPKTLDDVATVCELGGVDVQRYASGCSGTVVEASNGVQSATYTFDAEGKLIGVRSTGDVGDCDYWGTECRPVGASLAVCGAGGAGGAGGDGTAGAGEGGAGGAR